MLSLHYIDKSLPDQYALNDDNRKQMNEQFLLYFVDSLFVVLASFEYFYGMRFELLGFKTEKVSRNNAATFFFFLFPYLGLKIDSLEATVSDVDWHRWRSFVESKPKKCCCRRRRFDLTRYLDKNQTHSKHDRAQGRYTTGHRVDFVLLDDSAATSSDRLIQVSFGTNHMTPFFSQHILFLFVVGGVGDVRAWRHRRHAVLATSLSRSANVMMCLRLFVVVLSFDACLLCSIRCVDPFTNRALFVNSVWREGSVCVK